MTREEGSRLSGQRDAAITSSSRWKMNGGNQSSEIAAAVHSRGEEAQLDVYNHIRFRRRSGRLITSARTIDPLQAALYLF